MLLVARSTASNPLLAIVTSNLSLCNIRVKIFWFIISSSTTKIWDPLKLGVICKLPEGEEKEGEGEFRESVGWSFPNLGGSRDIEGEMRTGSCSPKGKFVEKSSIGVVDWLLPKQGDTSSFVLIGMDATSNFLVEFEVVVFGVEAIEERDEREEEREGGERERGGRKGEGRGEGERVGERETVSGKTTSSDDESGGKLTGTLK